MEEEQIEQADVTQYIDALGQQFRPAASSNETTHWYSTSEVASAIRDINPGAKVSLSKVHDAMIEAGYHYQPLPGAVSLNYRWMLQMK